MVSSLAAGIVDELLVVAGQRVDQGQPIAKLLDTDAKLALRQAEASLRLADADVKRAEAALAAARMSLEHPNELRAALADAESLYSETKILLDNLPFAIEAATVQLQLATENVDRKERAGDAIAGRILREARGELATAKSELAELQARQPSLLLQLEALQRKQSALRHQLQLMTEQKRALAESEAMLAAANARREQAVLARKALQLRLDRMTIRAPIAGRVLTVDARPGSRLAGLDRTSDQNASFVASLYDPAQLQVRVDVRLEDVPEVQTGQPVTIKTAVCEEPVAGEVISVTTQADVQKNTLQVKVAMTAPPDVITPEMLAQVTFLAPPQSTPTADAEQQRLRMLVPRNLVATHEGGACVWVADRQKGVALRRSVQIGRAGTEQLVEVCQGLDPTTKLIVTGRESLEENARIRVVGENPAAMVPFVAAERGSSNKDKIVQ
jgi:multidrug efflux pump subunit AcrA (membrane-fusion protein)